MKKQISLLNGTKVTIGTGGNPNTNVLVNSLPLRDLNIKQSTVTKRG